ncbi:hypothetical protein EDD91_0005 [Streptomyces sp. KS 21]|nr:hypothetical protein EDD91_0005 [Streptomyces sp. KS 21]
MTSPVQARLVVVLDCGDDAAFTHEALTAHAPHAGRITLHPTPGTTSDAALAGICFLPWASRPTFRAVSRMAARRCGRRPRRGWRPWR